MRHVLDVEGELGEDVQAGGVRLRVVVAQVGDGEVVVDVLHDLVAVHHHLLAVLQHRQLAGELLELRQRPRHVDGDDVVGEASGLGLEVQHHVEALAEGAGAVTDAVPARLDVQHHVVGGHAVLLHPGAHPAVWRWGARCSVLSCTGHQRTTDEIPRSSSDH